MHRRTGKEDPCEWAGNQPPSPQQDEDKKEFIMSHPVINEEECIGCGICVDACPQEVLEVAGGTVTVANEDSCIACGDCIEECPMGAITEVVED